jgi:hypothetical protein
MSVAGREPQACRVQEAPPMPCGRVLLSAHNFVRLLQQRTGHG